MSYYSTGTVSVTATSTAVTGVGTAWATALVTGGTLFVDGNACVIQSVNSNTSITLRRPYPGTTGAGKAYDIDLQNAAVASVVTTNQLLSQVIDDWRNNPAFIADFLAAATAQDALVAIGGNNAANLTTGVLADGRMPARLAISASPIADFNLATSNGWYISTTSTPINSPEAAWTFCRVCSWGTTYTLQEAFSIAADSDADTKAYRREQNNGVWGAWTRIRSSQTELDTRYSRIANDIHEFRNPDDSTSSLTIEAIAASVGRWVMMGAPTGFGPSLSISGTATNISGTISAKGNGGFFFGNALGRMFEVLAGAATFITDRILQIKPGSVSSGELASINALDGVDIKASGLTVLKVSGGLGNALLQIVNSSANYVTLASGTGDGLILSSDLGMQIKNVAYETWDYTAHDVANGGTVTINQFGGYQWIRPSGGAISGCTIALPATPEDGTIVHINTRSAITTITWTAGAGGVLNAPTTMNSLTPVAFQYRGTTFGWERVQ